MRLPDEHPIETFREWAKVVVPSLALLAASIAAGVSLMQLKLARASAERQDRAYVLPFQAAISSITESSVRIRVNILNTGKTPAKNAQAWMRADVSSFPLTGSLPADDRSPLLSKGPIGPGQTLEMPLHKTLSDAEIAAIKAGTSAVYVHGEISYEDAFGQVRKTWFRLYKGGNAGLENAALPTAPEGNDFD